jgi:hypothetical protein
VRTDLNKRRTGRTLNQWSVTTATSQDTYHVIAQRRDGNSQDGSKTSGTLQHRRHLKPKAQYTQMG